MLEHFFINYDHKQYNTTKIKVINKTYLTVSSNNDYFILRVFKGRIYTKSRNWMSQAINSSCSIYTSYA